MLNQTIDSMILEYNKQVFMIKRKTAKGFLIISMIFLLISCVFGFFYNVDEVLTVFFFVFLSLFLLFVFIAVMVNRFFTSEKPLYNYLYPLIIQDINYNEDINFSYTPYPKYSRDTAPFSMFPRYVSKVTRCKLSFESNDGYKTEIYDTYLFTSSKNSTTIYLDGYYFILNAENGPLIQLLQFGKPASKDPKYIKLNTTSDCKEYVVEGRSEVIDAKYYQLYDYLKTKSFNNKTNLASYDSSFHMSITSSKNNRKIKSLDSAIYSELRRGLLYLAELSEEAYIKIN